MDNSFLPFQFFGHTPLVQDIHVLSRISSMSDAVDARPIRLNAPNTTMGTGRTRFEKINLGGGVSITEASLDLGRVAWARSIRQPSDTCLAVGTEKKSVPPSC
jgi:hypothetical protein